MNDNTKLEIAVEIMAAKIAKTSRENSIDKDEKIAKLMEEKIINIYGKEIKQ